MTLSSVTRIVEYLRIEFISPTTRRTCVNELELGAALPMIEGWVAFFHRDKNSFTSGRHDVLRKKLHRNLGLAFPQLNHLRLQSQRLVHWRWSLEIDTKISSDGAGRFVRSGRLHQKVCGGPIHVAVKNRPDNASVEHTRKSAMPFLRSECRNDNIALDETF
jgi:hypothetical protein